MTRAGRVRAALAGETPDRTPFALWMPLPPDVTDGDGFVRAVLEFDEAYAPDLLKLPTAPWPLSEAAGAQRLEDLRRIRSLLGEDAPPMLESLPGDADAGEVAAWAAAAIAEGGCAGAFVVRPGSGWSPRGQAGLAGRLRAAGAWCLVAHGHDAEGGLPDWADVVSGPPEVLAGAARRAARMGGIDERLVAARTADEVRAEGRAAIRRYGPRRFLLAPGCAVPPWTPGANLRAIRAAAEAGA